ncbi:hypothetical protein AB4K20DRAFT_1868393 [Rhizopus microsporus]|uniref:Uncharacterized protein n=1 Tax=Rhizopus microsporus TaxID=58291 RepID=A0A1X0SF46_RHIZD|nr:hypothetical protein BCV71DRAFT_230990 [Rhizopus microsporus]
MSLSLFFFCLAEQYHVMWSLGEMHKLYFTEESTKTLKLSLDAYLKKAGILQCDFTVEAYPCLINILFVCEPDVRYKLEERNGHLFHVPDLCLRDLTARANALLLLTHAFENDSIYFETGEYKGWRYHVCEIILRRDLQLKTSSLGSPYCEVTGEFSLSDLASNRDHVKDGSFGTLCRNKLNTC